MEIPLLNHSPMAAFADTGLPLLQVFHPLAVHGNWVDASRIPEIEEPAIRVIPDLYPHVPTVKA